MCDRHATITTLQPSGGSDPLQRAVGQPVTSSDSAALHFRGDRFRSQQRGVRPVAGMLPQCGLRVSAVSVMIAIVVAFQLSAQETSKTWRFATVAEAISASVVGDPEGLEGGEAAINLAEFSPDGHSVAVVVRHGNLRENTIESSILVFAVRELFERLAADTVVTFASSSNRPPISHVRWLADNRTLVFVGERQGELPQVYSVDARTRALAYLTQHPTLIGTYDITPSGDVIAYTAELAGDTGRGTYRRQHGYTVTEGAAFDAMFDRPGFDVFSQETHLFIKHVRGGRLTEVADSGIGRCLDDFGVSVAPTGRFAVRSCYVLRNPPEWADYDDECLREALRVPEPNLKQYMLVDTERGTMIPLINAPLCWNAWSTIVWAPDARSVVIGNSYLPLDVPDSAARARRASTLALAEVDVTTHEAVPIAHGDSLKVARWDGVTNTLIAARGGWTQVSGWVAFRKVRGRWVRVPNAERARERTSAGPAASYGDIVLSLEQGLNEPPVLVATDLRRGKRVVVLDPNPQFRALRLGRVEAVTWSSKDGATWRGGLYYPPGYVKGRRYPLVIQTHGFDPNHFSFSGPLTTAFGAQPLAARGIVVLQVDDALHVAGAKHEAAAAMVGYEAAVEYLDELGLIDPGRVGLIGFSRTCWYVKYALTHSRRHFAAASMTDGVDHGYLQYLLFPSDQAESEFDVGAAPFGKGLDSWRREAPGFNLEEVQSPVRLEAIGPVSVLSQWEWYAGLKRLKKPVELHVIPDGTHELAKPWERLSSAQGNVDWFTFWLLGEEDPDSAKAEQYARWRDLRNLQPRIVPDTGGRH
jgi:dipeptidyl aminopeptidase/acylaminoacyl peptidase